MSPTHRPARLSLVCGLLLLLLLGVCRAPVARAGGAASRAASIEWAVADSDLIIRATVERLDTVDFDRHSFPRVDVRVVEVIKGPAPGAAGAIAAGARLTVNAPDVGPEVGGEYVMFVYDMAHRTRPAGALKTHLISELQAVYAAGPYALRCDDDLGHNPWPLDPGQGAPAFLSVTGRRVGGAELLPAVRAMAARPQATEACEISFSYSSEVFGGLLIDGEYPPTYLAVPLDDLTRAQAARWAASRDPVDRFNAVSVIASTPSDADAALLGTLLDDPMVFWDGPWWFDGPNAVRRGVTGKWTSFAYPIRIAAARTLMRWGRPTGRVAVTIPLYPPAPLPVWAPALTAVATGGAVIWVLARGRVLRGRARRLTGVGGAGLVLLVPAAGLWAVSYARVAELVVPTMSGHRYEVCALAGRLRVARFDDAGPPGPVTWVSLRRDPAGRIDDRWQLPPESMYYPAGPPPTIGRWAGVEVVRDTLDGPLGPEAYAAWSVPLWMPCAALALPAALRAGAGAHRYRRSARRARLGLCVACGYDLSYHPRGARCPECGTVAGPAGAGRRVVGAGA